jgi:lipoic acid synthetase
MTSNSSNSATPQILSPPSARQAGAARCVHARFPSWMKRVVGSAGKKDLVERYIGENRLHTVCVEARCPNRAECFSKGTATFLVMGGLCTRSCRFCNVSHGTPVALDPDEPRRVAQTARSLGLSHVVVTSVTRDDVPDGGAAHFAATVREIKKAVPDARVEVLVPDFQGNFGALATVLDSGPDVFNHNIETVPRLYERIRPGADYQRSLAMLKHAAEDCPGTIVKSGLMAGLGETDGEIAVVLADLRACGCSVVTIGQYLRPSSAHAPVQSFVTPEQFSRYSQIGKTLGFRRVFAGPYVRSSYMAAEVFEEHRKQQRP